MLTAEHYNGWMQTHILAVTFLKRVQQWWEIQEQLITQWPLVRQHLSVLNLGTHHSSPWDTTSFMDGHTPNIYSKLTKGKLTIRLAHVWKCLVNFQCDVK